jgi:hypothetical protein
MSEQVKKSEVMDAMVEGMKYNAYYVKTEEVREEYITDEEILSYQNTYPNTRDMSVRETLLWLVNNWNKQFKTSNIVYTVQLEYWSRRYENLDSR